MIRYIGISSVFLFLLSENSFAQSYEETNFQDITTIPSASRSANFIDVNNDGWDDLFITNGPASGADNMLYINNKNGTFTTVTNDDITTDSDRSDGASFADADNDGDLDAFVVTFGASGVGKKNYFYRNNGDGSFNYEPNIAMGIPLTYSEMATWIDVNNDQNLDLYFTNSFGSLRNLYFENKGDGSFEQITTIEITDNLLPSRSVDWIDYDGDGDSDLFVTNESNENNSLFRNDGPNNFTQITNLAIVEDNNGSAGSSWADIDNDGDFDLFVANYDSNGQPNQLYINSNGTFAEDTNSTIASASTNSFGSAFGDVDNDGDLDLFVCNAYLAGQNTNFLYINDGSGNFTLDTSSDLANHQGWTFGAAFGDYDNDGWLDILLANNLNDNQSNSLYHNTGTGNNWVKLNLQGINSNASAVGAIIQLTSVINGNEVRQTRKIGAASGYCGQNSFTVHFGLGNATSIDQLVVKWPAGTSESFSDLAINEIHPIIEGTGTFGVAEHNRMDFSIFPNPVQDVLTITSAKFSRLDTLSLNVYTTTGTLVKAFKAEVKPEGKSFTIPVSALSNGIYFFKLFHDNTEIGGGKFIKE